MFLPIHFISVKITANIVVHKMEDEKLSSPAKK
jgi:hypothetical protein